MSLPKTAETSFPPSSRGEPRMSGSSMENSIVTCVVAVEGARWVVRGGKKPPLVFLEWVGL
jgi:hypothetical protein